MLFITTKTHCLEARVGFDLKCFKDTQNINLPEQSAKANKNSLVFETTKGVDIFILFTLFFHGRLAIKADLFTLCISGR